MPGCSDVITDGWNGYLVPPRSPSELAARILDLLDAPARARLMGQRSKDLVVQNFGLDRIASQYANLYREVLGGSDYSSAMIDGAVQVSATMES